MKKSLALLLMAFSASSIAAGYSGPTASMPSTVQAALDATDESQVTITGNIIMSNGDEVYTFQDSTGQIKVEIDNDLWMGININDKSIVTLRGEVEKEAFEDTVIDVDSITIK